MGSDGSFMKLREEHHPPVGYSHLQKLTGLGQAGLFPTGTGFWASLAFTHGSQVDFKCAHGFLKDCFIFSDARDNGFIDSSFHWGHMRWLLFSHWLRPTTISTFLAGAGRFKRHQINCFPSPAVERQPDSCCLLSKWVGSRGVLCRAKEMADLWTAALMVWGLDSADGSGDERTSPNWGSLVGLSLGLWETLLLPLRNDGPLGCV